MAEIESFHSNPVKRKLEKCDVAETHISKHPKRAHTGRKSVEIATNVIEIKFWIMAEELRDIISSYVSYSAFQISRAVLNYTKLPPCALKRRLQVAHGLV